MDKSLVISDLLELYGSLLTDKQRNFIDLYYNEDFSLAEISENYGISRQGVNDSIKRGEAYLFHVDSSLKLHEKLNSINSFLKELLDICEKLSVYNNNYIKSTEIDDYSKSIISKLSEYISKNI